MSNSEGDIDDELLALIAGGGESSQEKKRKKSSSRQGQQSGSSSKSKKRKVSMESDSEQPESEEDTEANPYPFDGKYIDEEDRQQLLSMNEMERETIIASRLEEMQKIVDKRNLDQMLRENRGDSASGDNVAKAAKRQHAQRGVTKEKTRKLDELKAKRKAKDDRKRTRTNSPRRDRSSSPMDMETSDEEEEDGQISKLEQEELLLEKENEKKKDEPMTLMDLESCRLSRETLVKHSMKPWFEDFVRGAWVRFLVGNDPATNTPQYRICEITRVLPCEKPYKLDNEMTDLQFELKHGKSVKIFRMDLVSNSAFTEREFERMEKTYAAEKEKPPSKFTLEKKKEQLTELANRTWNEADLSKMLARKQKLASNTSNQSPTMLALERGRLLQQRSLAGKRGDHAEVTELDIRLQEINSKLNSVSRAGSEGAEGGVLSKQEILAQVNERNRRANMEAVRKNELMESERKRRERKMGAAPGSLTPVDPSARLKTMPRVFNSATPISRPSTPATPPVSKGGPSSSLAKDGSASPVKKARALETSFLASIEVDLGDF